MKKFIKYLFIFCVLISGVFVKNLTVSNEIVASAASTYETDFINAFADDENLSRIQSSSLSQTSFNILDRVDYEFYDQDQYGTCYAFSLAQMLNLSYEYKTGEHIRLSAIALALQFRNIFFNDGSYGFEIIQNSYNLDYVSEYDFPYEIAKMYYDAQTTTKDVNLNFEGKEILDVEEYYYFPLISSTFSTETRNLCVENIKKALVLDGALTMGINYTVKTSGEYLIYEPTVASIVDTQWLLLVLMTTFQVQCLGTQPTVRLSLWTVGEQMTLIYIYHMKMFLLLIILWVQPDLLMLMKEQKKFQA